jgi:TolA-binding protein
MKKIKKFLLILIVFISFNTICTNTQAWLLPKDKNPQEFQEYVKVMKIYNKEIDKSKAIEAFKEYLKSYPSTENAEKVQFMIGECMFYEAVRAKVLTKKDSLFYKAIKQYKKVNGKSSLFEDAKFRIGECFYNLGKINKAIEIFKEIATSDFKYYLKAESLYSLVICYLALSKFNLAEEMARKLLKLFPAYKNQEKIYFPLGLIYYQKKRLKEALKLLEKSLTDDSLYYQGLINIEMNKPLIAIVKFKKLIKEYPKSKYLVNSKFLLGEMYYQSKDFCSAIEEYQKFRKLYPKSKLAIFALYKECLSLYYQKKYKEAIKLGKYLIKKYPQDNLAVLTNYLIGNCYYSLNKIGVAIFAFGNLIKKYPEKEISILAQYKISWLRFLQERYLSIVFSLDEFINIHPSHKLMDYIYFLHGKCYQRMGNSQGAIYYFKKVLDKTENIELAEAVIYSMCETFYLQKDYDQIIGNCRFLLNSFPFTKSIWRANALLLIADSYYRLGLTEEAKEIYNIVLSNFPKSEAALFANDGLMWCYIQNEEYEKAVKIKDQIADSLIEGKIKDKFLIKSEYERANCLFNQGKYLEALDAYEKYVKDYPEEENAAEALYNSALCYYRMQYYTQAIQAWKELIQNYKSSEKCFHAAYRIADTYFRTGKYSKSIKAYQEIINRFPESKGIEEAFFKIGLCYFNDNKDQETIKAIKTFIFKFPNDPRVGDAFDIIEASIYRKETLLQKSSEKDILKKSRLALIQIMEKYIKEFPKSELISEIQYRLAKKYYEIENYKKSIAEFKKVVINFPDSSSLANTLYYLGESYYHLNNFQDAIETYERFVVNFPDHKLAPMALFRQGTAYYNLSNYDKAINSYKKIVKDYPDNNYAPAAQFNCALCYKNLNKYEEAVREYKLFQELYPQNEMINDTLVELGIIYQKLRQYAQAISTYKKLQDNLNSDDPERVEISYRVANIYLKIGEEEKAIKEFEKIYKMKPYKNPYRLSALAKLGDIYENKKIWKKALRIYQDIEKNVTKKTWKKAALSRIKFIKNKIRERRKRK